MTVVGKIKSILTKNRAIAFYVSSFYGYFVYRKLNFFLTNNVLLINPFPGIGDIFLIAKYIPEYLEKNNIKKYKFIVCTDSIVDACSMYEQLKIKKISKKKMDSLIRYSFISWEYGKKIRILHHHIVQDNTTIGFFSQGINKTNQKDMLINCDLNVSGNGPVFDANYHMKDNLLESLKIDYYLDKEKTVIVAPYSNSFRCMEEAPEFWPTVVKRLQEKGYVVYTNVNGKEEPLPGTESILSPISVMRTVLDNCHAFISARSGLCDVIADADCNCVCLYNESCRVGQNSCSDYYNLHDLGLSRNAIEITMKPSEAMSYIDKVVDAAINGSMQDGDGK